MAPNGIAQLSADGCNLLLPVRGVYERQVLLDHLVHLVHLKGAVRVTLDGRTWSVSQGGEANCTRCGRNRLQLQARASLHTAPLCGECAFTADRPKPPHRKLGRRPAYRSTAHTRHVHEHAQPAS